MRKALKEYNNEPYDFETKGLIETMMESLSANAAENQA